MKELLVKLFWIVICSVAIIWGTYQTWHWFITQKFPF